MGDAPWFDPWPTCMCGLPVLEHPTGTSHHCDQIPPWLDRSYREVAKSIHGDLLFAAQVVAEKPGCECDPVGSGEAFCTGRCYARAAIAKAGDA